MIFSSGCKRDSADVKCLYDIIVKAFVENKVDYKTNLIGFTANGVNNVTSQHISVTSLLFADCKNLFVMKLI